LTSAEPLHQQVDGCDAAVSASADSFVARIVTGMVTQVLYPRENMFDVIAH